MILNAVTPFSAFSRDAVLDRMSERTLDVLVIGGGITGAGIALDAASRGLRVGLIDKQDFAAGTSSRSTKLIHGGLRYLKQLDIGLVREVGKERAIVYKNAPHLVKPEHMLLPIIKGGSLSKFTASIALYIYELLAGVDPKERRQMLSKSKTAVQEPLLNKDLIEGAALYYEYRTDDARLVIEVLKTANAYGAYCINYAKAIDLLYENNKITAALVRDELSGKLHTVKAKYIINASGPWVDQLREQDNSLKGKRLHLTKGVHIVVSKEKLPIKQSVYFDTTDGRMVFAIPRGSTTYIGTTDTNYSNKPDSPGVSKEDVTYLLDAVNKIFPSGGLRESDIISSWAGLRPLIHEDGKSPSELSRKDEIFVAPSGLISIAGGKLTGYRMMAKRVTDLVMKELSQNSDVKFRSCFTHKIILSGGEFSSTLNFDDFVDKMLHNQTIGADKKTIASLASKYGTHTPEVLKKAAFAFADEHNLTKAILYGEIQYTLTNEMTSTLNDFVIRRTGKLFFEHETLAEWAPYILDEMAKFFNWDEAFRKKNWEEFEMEYKKAIEFR